MSRHLPKLGLRRARIARFLLVVVGGVIVNVAVAWACAWNEPLLLNRAALPRPCFVYMMDECVVWRVWSYRSFGTRHFESSTEVPFDVPASARYLHEFDNPSRELPRWTRPREGDPGTVMYVLDAAFGWPVPSLRVRYTADDPSYRDGCTHDAITIEDRTTRRDLPVGPMAAEFAINTMFYAAILWLLFAGPFALRRAIHRRRNQCPACGFPIGRGEVCTECGKPLRGGQAAPATLNA